MTDRVIHFDAVTIHRVPGFRHGEGFTLSGLSPGINLIHGPNGSGKSTTARVIQELLWPGRTGLERPTVAGQFRDGERVWRVQLDAGHVETTCDGRSGTLPELGPPENRHRYQLALHELIGADNAEFAKAIADASQGGYDLESAAAVLGFTPRPPRRAGKPTRCSSAGRLLLRRAAPSGTSIMMPVSCASCAGGATKPRTPSACWTCWRRREIITRLAGDVNGSRFS